MLNCLCVEFFGLVRGGFAFFAAGFRGLVCVVFVLFRREDVPCLDGASVRAVYAISASSYSSAVSML